MYLNILIGLIDISDSRLVTYMLLTESVSFWYWEGMGEQGHDLPQEIGQYKVEALLARGGMSLVYLGHDPVDPEKKVVLKVLLPEYTQESKMNERFINEAKILGQVYHPNIPKIYKVGQWDKGLFIAMEYFQGISLRSFIREQSFSLRKALEVIVKIGYALYHLHSYGIVHRDLKPENVILTEDGEVKVVDFGFSQLIPEEELEHRIEDPHRVGTPWYMAPEQREDPRLVTKATDIYALGIIAFELILGKSTHGVIQTFLLPGGLRQIVEEAIQIKPELRYADVYDFIEAISKYIKKLDLGKEEREVAQAGPVKDLLDHIQSIFIPQKAPHVLHFEIHFAYSSGMAIHALYLEFFQLEGGRMGLFLAEPLKTGINSLFHMFNLRGMIHLESTQNQNFSTEMLRQFSKTLYRDPKSQKFGACTLVLDPQKEQVIFSSCKFIDLWHLAKNELKIHETRGNPALGHYSKASFQEKTIDLKQGETLILYSHPMDLKGRKERQKTILESGSMKGETLACHLLKQLSSLSPTATHKGSLLIVIDKKN